MPTQALEVLLVLLQTVLCLGLLVERARFSNHPAPPRATRRDPRPLRPCPPDDCQFCRDTTKAPLTAVARPVVPYAQRKSQRGPLREKTIDTRGQACPNPDCEYRDITDPALHALVGYGYHGRQDPIQDFYCQACHRKFTARRYTPLHRLRSPTARVFQVSETTVRSWISRAGQHSYHLHNWLMRALQLTHVQLDELRLKLHGTAEAAWLWVACDARTKIIPAFTLGPRTQALAHHLVHEVALRLAPGCLPVFSSDGLTLYFYALTAHFGEWVQTEGERRRTWVASAQLLYAQVVKCYRHRQIMVVRHQVLLGKPEDYRQALGIHGFSGRIQTAFIERLNLTIRRSIAGLDRRSLSTAHSLGELTLQFEWWRAVYHFARPHHSLRQPLGPTPAQLARQRFRPRTPAQAAGLTPRRWTILEVLTYPAPPLTSG